MNTISTPNYSMIPAYYHGRPNTVYVERFLTGARVRRSAATA